MQKNRLRWASRRGMLELDLVLLPFLDNHFDQISAEEQQLFERLLTEEDQDLFSWLIHRQRPADSDLHRIVCKIRDMNASS